MTQATLNLFNNTTHTDLEAGTSQKARLYRFLSDGEWHTTVEIMKSVYGIHDHFGIARIGARVYDLKKDGLQIECRKERGSVYSYRLVS